MQHGFDNVPATLCRLFERKNIGKQLLAIDAN
jgi:NADPH-dependent curcumin reductase CurA